LWFNRDVLKRIIKMAVTTKYEEDITMEELYSVMVGGGL
jgi:hypothetical protein